MTKKRSNEQDNENENDTKKFQKLSDREHILARPDMYCNSTDPVTTTRTVINANGKIREVVMEMAPALLQVVMEAVMNASDRVSARYEPSSNIQVRTTKIHIDVDGPNVSVLNDGDGIACEFLEEYGVYAPELIFAHLRTSSNYNDEEQRLNVGRNGIGIKTTNIFSKNMTIETIDPVRCKKFLQVYSENMSVIGKPKITSAKCTPYTKVSFTLDLEKFGVDTLDENMVDLLRLKAHEMCMCSLDKIKVKFNGVNIKTDSPDKYLNLYSVDKSNMISSQSDRWKVAIAFTPENGSFKHHSFVNSTSTQLGGTHLNHIMDPLVKSLCEIIRNKYKLKKLRPSLVRDALTCVISAHVINPTFSSQTKDLLTLNPKEFGSSFEIPDAFVNKLLKCGLMEHIGDKLRDKESAILKDSDGKKSSTVKGIPDLHDAKWAGTKKSGECYLIVTEGKSALTMALSAMSVIGRDRFGAFPLRGKLLNVRDASPSVVSNNVEITNLKKILGLQSGVHYNDTGSLRYTGIICLTDSDVDGVHIRGLILNLFEVFWPSLLGLGFVHTVNTPIVRATKGKDVKLFYNDHEYKEWVNENNKGYSIKYLKGLGSSTANEAREYFKDVYGSIVKYTSDIRTTEKMSLAFDKKRASDRKGWLVKYDKDLVLDMGSRKIEISEFVDKELIHFSIYDVQRSVPSCIDGFKVSQRKAIYGSFKNGIVNTEAKVAQLTGFVSDKNPIPSRGNLNGWNDCRPCSRFRGIQ